MENCFQMPVHRMVIGGIIFPHEACHLATWVSPDLKTENQIDHRPEVKSSRGISRI